MRTTCAYEARDGFTVGIPVQYDFRDWFGLRADLVFVQKGQKMHRTDTYNAIHTDTRNNYLQLPVMASFSFGGERLRGFLNAGGYVGGWLSSHRKGVTHRFFSDENGDENGVVVPGTVMNSMRKYLSTPAVTTVSKPVWSGAWA